VNISTMVGLPSVALASSPPSGRARSRLRRIVLLRSQESSKASRRGWSSEFDIAMLGFLRDRVLVNFSIKPARKRVSSEAAA
jgi:hypothetical protein